MSETTENRNQEQMTTDTEPRNEADRRKEGKSGFLSRIFGFLRRSGKKKTDDESASAETAEDLDIEVVFDDGEESEAEGTPRLRVIAGTSHERVAEPAETGEEAEGSVADGSGATVAEPVDVGVTESSISAEVDEEVAKKETKKETKKKGKDSKKEKEEKKEEIIYVDETATFHGVKGNKIAVLCPANFQCLRFSAEAAKNLKKKEKINWIRFQLEKEKQISVTELSYIEEGDEIVAFGMSDPLGGKRRGKIVMAGVVAYQHHKLNVPKTALGVYLFATSQTVSFYVVGRGEVITSRRVGIEMAQIALQEIVQYIEHQFPGVDVFYFANTAIGGDFEVMDVKAVVDTLPPTAFVSTSTYIPTKGIAVVALSVLIVFMAFKDVYEGMKYFASLYNYKKLESKYSREKHFYEALRRILNRKGVPESYTHLIAQVNLSPLAISLLEADDKSCYILGYAYALTDYGKKLIEEFVYAHGGRVKAENKGKVFEIKYSFVKSGRAPGKSGVRSHRSVASGVSLSYFAVSGSFDEAEDVHEEDSGLGGEDKRSQGKSSLLSGILEVISGRSAFASSQGASELGAGRRGSREEQRSKRNLPPPPEFVRQKTNSKGVKGTSGSARKDSKAELQRRKTHGNLGESRRQERGTYDARRVDGPPLPPRMRGDEPGFTTDGLEIPPHLQGELLEKELSEPFLDPIIMKEFEHLRMQIAALQNEKEMLLKRIEEMQKAKTTREVVNPDGYYLAAVIEGPTPERRVYVIKSDDGIIMIKPGSGFSYENKLLYVKSFDETTKTLLLSNKDESLKVIFTPASLDSSIRTERSERAKKVIEKKKKEEKSKSTKSKSSDKKSKKTDRKSLADKLKKDRRTKDRKDDKRSSSRTRSTRERD